MSLQEKLVSSAYVMTLTPDDEIDEKIALETGMAVLLGKPMVVVSWPGRTIPPGLRRYAMKVIELPGPPTDEASRQMLMAELAGWHPPAVVPEEVDR